MGKLIWRRVNQMMTQSEHPYYIQEDKHAEHKNHISETDQIQPTDLPRKDEIDLNISITITN